MSAKNGINSPHYAAGSTNPIKSSDKITFINMRFCPYAQRSALVLYSKNIPFETVNVNLKSKPEWFLELNPLGKVPVIILPNKEILFESEIVSDYLDETFNVENKLSADDTLQRAKDKRDVALFSKAIMSYYALGRAKSDMENYDQVVDNFKKSFLLLENNLHERNTNFFSGNEKPGMVDYMIWPWIERIDPTGKISPQMKLDKDCFPKLLAWKGKMVEDPAVKAYSIPDEIHEEFLRMSLAGKVDYNGLCERLK